MSRPTRSSWNRSVGCPAELRAKELERFKELLDGQARGLDRIRARLDHEPPSPFRNFYEQMWRDMTEANQQLRRRHDELTQGGGRPMTVTEFRGVKGRSNATSAPSRSAANGSPMGEME